MQKCFLTILIKLSQSGRVASHSKANGTSHVSDRSANICIWFRLWEESSVCSSLQQSHWELITAIMEEVPFVAHPYNKKMDFLVDISQKHSETHLSRTEVGYGPQCEWNCDFSAEMHRSGKLEIYCFPQSEYVKNCIQPKHPHNKRNHKQLPKMN